MNVSVNEAVVFDEAELAAGDAKRWLNALTREEIQELRRMNDWRSWASLAVDWGLVFASFALVAYAPNPLTILLALVVIGTRQLGLSVLMHEAAHRTLLKNRTLNDFVGNWLCAYPVWSDIGPYRRYHLQLDGRRSRPEPGNAVSRDVGEHAAQNMARPHRTNGVEACEVCAEARSRWLQRAAVR
jgi:hypothetical protein